MVILKNLIITLNYETNIFKLSSCFRAPNTCDTKTAELRAFFKILGFKDKFFLILFDN